MILLIKSYETCHFVRVSSGTLQLRCGSNTSLKIQGYCDFKTYVLSYFFGNKINAVLAMEKLHIRFIFVRDRIVGELSVWFLVHVCCDFLRVQQFITF